MWKRLKDLNIQIVYISFKKIILGMVSPSIPIEDGVKVMKKEPEMMCIDSRGINRGQFDQIISTQYLVWTNSLLQLFPMSTHIPLNWVPNKTNFLKTFLKSSCTFKIFLNRQNDSRVQKNFCKTNFRFVQLFTTKMKISWTYQTFVAF